MQPLQLLSTLRAIANNTLTACQRQEFKPEFIYKTHNAQLTSIQSAVKGYKLNAKVSAKYNAEINKLRLDASRNKDYYFIQEQIQRKLKTLTSAVEFMKR